MKRIIKLITALTFSCFSCLLLLGCASKTYTLQEIYDNSPQELTFTVGEASFTMKKVDGGTFQMGATIEQKNDARENEYPVRSVKLQPFYIGETEVTQNLWYAVMGRNPSRWKGNDLPVEEINWDDCQVFILRLNQMTAQKFRLPTEAEWEYAARGGHKSMSYKYAGSDNIEDVAWYHNNSGIRTHPVKSKLPNELGLYDMNGNVYEWCQDVFVEPYRSCIDCSHVMRGGCWQNAARDCRVSSCGAHGGAGYANIGSRLALDL